MDKKLPKKSKYLKDMVGQAITKDGLSLLNLVTFGCRLQSNDLFVTLIRLRLYTSSVN